MGFPREFFEKTGGIQVHKGVYVCDERGETRAREIKINNTHSVRVSLRAICVFGGGEGQAWKLHDDGDKRKRVNTRAETF